MKSAIRFRTDLLIVGLQSRVLAVSTSWTHRDG